MKAKELVKKCEEKLKVGWDCEFVRLARYSFIGEFGAIREGIREDMAFDDPAEVKRFIEVCDNRIARAKTFLNDIAMVFGFTLTSLSLVAVIPSDMPVKLSMTLVISLLMVLIILFLFLLHYRTHMHTWTAFKEEAILNENYLPQSPTQTK
ncbi:MAG: hypothetical protein KAT65_24300 [Methanophagales archaeon]|nr:hypothetical protein [Methanophagales archaeon]